VLVLAGLAAEARAALAQPGPAMRAPRLARPELAMRLGRHQEQNPASRRHREEALQEPVGQPGSRPVRGAPGRVAPAIMGLVAPNLQTEPLPGLPAAALELRRTANLLAVPAQARVRLRTPSNSSIPWRGPRPPLAELPATDQGARAYSPLASEMRKWCVGTRARGLSSLGGFGECAISRRACWCAERRSSC
jgi:hypothetical protein